MKDRGALALDDQLCFALYRAQRALTRAYGTILEPLGLTYPQYLVLLALWEEDDASVKDLGERLALDSGTLTPLLKRLEEQGVVERRRSEEDERVVRVLLTRRGRALEAKARAVPLAIACRAGFELEDPAELARLRRLRDELNRLAKDLTPSEG